MFTETELRAKGGKRAVLEYIAQEDSSIPIPETIGESDIQEGTILRSDHWREFDSFYGVFETIHLGKTNFHNNDGFTAGTFIDKSQAIDYMLLRDTGNKDIDRETSSHRLRFKEYCKAKSLDPEEVLREFKVFPQRFVDSRITGTLLLHPNVDNRYLVYMESNKESLMSSFMVDFIDGLIGNFRGCFFKCGEPKKYPDDALIEMTGMEQVIRTFDRIKSMPKLQDGYSYMMEFTYDPFFVLQMRRFRKIESGSQLNCDWKEKENVLHTNISFGLTPPEGINLPLFIGPTGYGYVFKHEDWNGDFYDFNDSHPGGFAYYSNDGNWHTKTFVKNTVAALGNGFGHYFNHGNAATFSEMPIYLFDIGDRIKDSELPKYGGYGKEGIVRIFSNGNEGYVKLVN